MSRRIITIPLPLMRSTSCDWDIDWAGQSAGASNDNMSQVVFNRFPRWIGSPSISLHGDLINAWRAVRARAQGRAGIYRVPMIDLDHMPDMPDGILFDPDVPFDDGDGFAFEPFVTCAAGAEAGADEIVVQETDFEARLGQFMSHDDWPFVVAAKAAEGAAVRLTIEMPLRRAIPAGAHILLRAWGLFEATDDMMGNPAYGLVKVSAPQLSFREWLNRP